MNPPHGLDIGTYTPYAASNPFTDAVQQFMVTTVAEPAHDITRYLMPIKDLKNLTGAPVVYHSIITILARVADPRPIGAPAATFGTQSNAVKVKLERVGLGFHVNADGIMTEQGMADALMKRKVVEDSVKNTTLVVALRALVAEQRDVARLLRVHLAEENLRRVERESSRLGAELAGILNRVTGGVANLVETFNKMFRFYGATTKYLLMTPATAANLAVRPEVPGHPGTAINPDHTRFFLANSPTLNVIACPELPWDGSGELSQILARPVYASSFILVLPECDGKRVTGVRVFDGRRRELPVLNVGKLLKSDPSLLCTHRAIDFTHSPYGYGTVDELRALDAELRAGTTAQRTFWDAAVATVDGGLDGLIGRLETVDADEDMKKYRAENLLLMHADVIRQASNVVQSAQIRPGFFDVADDSVFEDNTRRAQALHPSGSSGSLARPTNAIFHECVRANRLLAPVILVRPVATANANTVIGFSGPAGTVYTTTPGKQTASQPYTSDIHSQYFWFVGALVHSPQNLCRASLAFFEPAVAGMGVAIPPQGAILNRKLSETMNANDPWEDDADIDSTKPATRFDLLPISIKSGSADFMSKIVWMQKPAGDEDFPEAEEGDDKKGTSIFVSRVLKYVGLDPVVKDSDGQEDGAQNALQFCVTRYTTQNGHKNVYTLVPEAATLMSNGAKVVCNEGMHPYGAVLTPPDIFRTSGKVGSAVNEVIHGILQTTSN